MKHIALVSSLAMAGGCLGNHYEIPRRDLQAMAHAAPADRNQHVRVIQGFAGGEAPPPVPRGHNAVYVNVYTPVGVGPAPIRTVTNGATLAAAKTEDAKAWLVLAAVATLVAAGTEGMRYDGWANLHPEHPIHLYGPRGEYTWVPLAGLTPETAAWASKAYIREGEGPIQRTGRAPLNRIGLTWSLLMGTSEFDSIHGSPERGFMSHLGIGFFTTQQLGFQVDLALGWAENIRGDAVFDSRYGIEVDYLPLSVSRLHGGVFGEVGLANRFEDGLAGTDRRSFLASGGAIAQFELTTRLALTARAGITHVHGNTISDLTAGISIY